MTLAPDIKEELPVLYLRLRHAAVEKGVPIIEISPGPTGLSSRATECLHYRPGELSSLVEALCGGTPVKDDIAGIPAQQVERARSAIASVTRDAAAPRRDRCRRDRCRRDRCRRDRGRRDRGPRLAVVLGRASLAEPSTATAAAARLLARLPGVSFLPALRRSNVHGAMDFGLSPGLLPGRVGPGGRPPMVRAPLGGTPARDGRALTPWACSPGRRPGSSTSCSSSGADPLSDCPDSQLAAQALDGAGFVVAIDAFRTASIARADVVLPAAMYTERRGTFTNLEGRVSWLGQKVTAPGTARPDWMIAVELASRLGASLGAASLEELWAEIETVSPLHRGVSQALLVSRQGRNGVVVPLALEAPAAELTDMPAPLDPMADPGIASAELHPAPPVLPSVVDPGAGRTHWPSPGPREPRPRAARPARAGGAGRSARQRRPGWPPRLGLGRPAVAPAPAPPPAQTSGSRRDRDQGDNGHALRLVVSRPMWDGGVLVQRSPSLARLHPPARPPGSTPPTWPAWAMGRRARSG